MTDSRPLASITQQARATSERDGVVCLRRMFPASWLELPLVK